MFKKIIDVPSGTELIDMRFFASVDTVAIDYPNGDATVLVENLTDAPNKPVIELSADVIAIIEEIKQCYNANLYGFMKQMNSNNEALRREISNEIGSDYADIDGLLAEWYLGYVEFEPKNDTFSIAVEAPNGFPAWVGKDDNGTLLIDYYKTGAEAQRFTEQEADEIVASLLTLRPKKMQG